MKVYVIEFLERYCGNSCWTLEKIYENEDKAKRYCEKMSKQWNEKYRYKEYIVEN